MSIALSLSMALLAAEPKPLPLVGSDELDPWGMSVRTADKVAIRKLLFDRQFEELNRLLVAFQAEARDCRRELLAFDAFESFSSADPALDPFLDEFVKKAPGFAAPLARSQHLLATAIARRGTGWAKDTTEAQFKAMNEAADRARADIERSWALEKTLVAQRTLIDLDGFQGRPQSSKAERLKAGLKLCPASLQLHMKLMGMSTPRWGGSEEEMARIAERAPLKSNPKLSVLKGSVHLDRCNTAVDERNDDEAVAACTRAVEAAPYWEFHYERALVYLSIGRVEDALKDLDAAAFQRPQKPRVHTARAQAFARLGRWSEAQESVALVRALDPFEKTLPWVEKKFGEACDRGVKAACLPAR